MKHTSFLLFVLALMNIPTAQSQDLLWGKQIDDNDTGHLYIHDNAVDKQGNIYLTGQFGGTIDFDPGAGIYSLSSPNNIAAFVAKYDSSGAIIWASSVVSDSTLSIGTDIVALTLDNGGNVYVTGYFQGATDFDPGPGTNYLTANAGEEMFVQRLDHAGNLDWVMGFQGTQSVRVKDIAVDSNRELYLTGTFGVTADFDPFSAANTLTAAGELDIFVLKISVNNTIAWCRQISGPASEYPASIAVDKEKNIYLTGYFYGTADFDPGPGNYSLSSNGYGDGFVAKLDMQGVLEWAGSFGDSGEDAGLAIACDDKGNSYVTGRFMRTVDFDLSTGVQNLISEGYYDAFILKLDQAGSFNWVRQFGEKNRDEGMSLSLSAGAVNTAIYFLDSMDLDPGAGSLYMGKAGQWQHGYVILDTSGNLKWAMVQDHNIYMPHGSHLATDAWGYIYATARFMGKMECDPGPAVYTLVSPDHQHSHFILKLKPAATAPTAVEDRKLNCRIYPNPTDGLFHISAAQRIEKIEVIDMMGKRVHYSEPGRKDITVRLDDPGVYTVSLFANGSVTVEKIVVEGGK